MILIDRDALEKAIYEWMPKNQEEWMDSTIPPIENLIVSIMMTIQEQQPVDAELVRHGKWLWLDGVRCSQCNHKLATTGLPSYCPNCGAKMDGEQEKKK